MSVSGSSGNHGCGCGWSLELIPFSRPCPRPRPRTIIQRSWTHGTFDTGDGRLSSSTGESGRGCGGGRYIVTGFAFGSGRGRVHHKGRGDLPRVRVQIVCHKKSSVSRDVLSAGSLCMMHRVRTTIIQIFGSDRICVSSLQGARARARVRIRGG